MNPRLHGASRSDAQGRYRYETIRPGGYDNNAAHVHYVVAAPGYRPRLLDLWFEDDPILVARRQAGEPEIFTVPCQALTNEQCRVDVTAAGAVVSIEGVGETIMSLSGISFRLP